MKKGLIMSLCILAFSIFTSKDVGAIEQLTTPGLVKETATKLEYTDDGYYAQKSKGDDWYKFQTPSTPGYSYIYI